MNSAVMMKQNKIHPHKFTLWVGIGSILMMFAGLTSAYIVKRNQAHWETFNLPGAFWYSTVLIIGSSLTMIAMLKAFQARLMQQYRWLLATTMLLGVLFIGTQVLGFSQLWQQGITLQANVAYSFLYVIVGLHALHVIGGVIALIVMWLKGLSRHKRNYSVVPVELMSTYWHFVDVLWLYLLVFLLLIR